MPDGRPERTDSRSYWIFQLFAWGFQGGYMLLLAWTTPSFFEWKAVSLEFARIGILALTSHGIVRMMMSRRWFTLKRSALVMRGLGICVLGSILPSVLFYNAIMEEWGEYYESSDFPFLADCLTNFAILAMWGGFFLAYQFHQLNRKSEIDRMRLATASREAELAALKSQLNPHFLFNSFNLLRALIQREPEVARDAVTHLTDMMRHSLRLAHQDRISLGSELHFVESYLELERLRYEERLRVSASVPDEFRNLEIPSMLLYTLVENAVKYGIDQDRGGVDVSYLIRREGEHLLLKVTNSGKLVKSGSSTGTGLANVRERLSLLYGDAASVDLAERDGQVVADVEWPARVLPGTL